MKKITIGSGIALVAAVAATVLLAAPAQAYSYSALGGTVTHSGGPSASYYHGSKSHLIGVGTSRGTFKSGWVTPGITVAVNVTGTVYGPFTYQPAVR
ncbi:hypothetical protein [Leifsonia sp. C5G2]|uniref:hypothetical protein n=1 Tax=Leifsonia sp. C5G2 TaxID=2735269 RepID=UPI001585CFF3|nr:hypothetical protein [Leifsonia sp. C5G2]NUU05330.1 hypothetical protein [Leifsonia sp. C5G2]